MSSLKYGSLMSIETEEMEGERVYKIRYCLL